MKMKRGMVRKKREEKGNRSKGRTEKQKETERGKRKKGDAGSMCTLELGGRFCIVSSKGTGKEGAEKDGGWAMSSVGKEGETDPLR